MAQFPFLNTNMAARALRAVCILGLTVVVAGAWALDSSPAASSTVPNSQPNALSSVKPTHPTTRPNKAPVRATGSHWAELTPAQQTALAPLAADWGSIDALRRKKWLVIANKFPTMKPEEQQRVQDRMREWVKLTPAQRRAIRESYARTKKMNAEQKSEKWQQYQKLPEEQKKKLAAEAARRKRLTNLPRVTSNRGRGTASSKSATKPAVVKPAVQQTAPSAPAQPAEPSPTK
jgi:hypothetical protein